MSNITYKSKQPTFPVFENGELSNDYVKAIKTIQRKRAAARTAKTTVRATQSLSKLALSSLAKQLRYAAFLIDLDVSDAIHGTNLRAEYFDKKRRMEVDRLRFRMTAF